MPILILLGVVVFMYFYIKFKSFRGVTHEVIKKTPNAIKEAAEKSKRNN